MGKTELATNVKNECRNISKADAKRAVDAVLNGIADTLRAGESVMVPGFGTFRVTDVKEREGRNPQTGEKMTIPAHKKVSFKPSKHILDSAAEAEA